jgi:hypothetical protein
LMRSLSVCSRENSRASSRSASVCSRDDNYQDELFLSS